MTIYLVQNCSESPQLKVINHNILGTEQAPAM